jgi:competence protein ComEC
MHLVALAFLGGILLVQQMPALPSLWWSVLLFPLAVVAWRRPFWLTALFFVAGIVWVSFRAGLILDDNLPTALEGKDLLVEGRIADIPQQTSFGERFALDVTRAVFEGKPVHLPGHILLNSQDDTFHPRAGESWRLLVRVNRPHGYQNPGGFDYEAHLFRNQWRAKGYVRPDTAPQLLDSGTGGYAINRLRQDLGEHIRALLPDNAYAGMVAALANGDSRGVTAEQWRVFRRTGTLHLVAISGLHITLIGGIVFFIARWLWALPGITVLRLPAPMFGAIAALLAASGYAALAGFAVPAQRALIMLAVAMSGILLRRRFAPTQLLAVALLLVLIYDPLAVMAAGLWLSFAAVAVILFAMQGDRQQTSLWRKWGYLQWAIALGMLPITLAMFQQVSVVAPLANMLAVPVFDLLAVPLTLTGVVAFSALPDSVAGVFFHAAAWLLQALWQVLEFFARLDFTQWVQPAPAPWTLLCALLGVALLLAPRGWPARWVGVIWLMPVLLVRPPGPGPGELWFTLLDVGQGLSAVVRTQTHALVFDTGPRFGETFDTGGSVVVPYLRAMDVSRIDTMIISHGDIDHIGGAQSVLAELPVSTVLSSVPERLAQAQPCRVGQAWQWDGVEFTMLNPEEGVVSGRANNASCVLRVRSRYGSVLLPADIEAKAERRLVDRYGKELRADILVAPHHGSKTSSTTEFIGAVAPRYVLFPVGYRNRYHHPNRDVAGRYASLDIAALDSPTSGAVEFRLREAGMELAPYRARHKRYWYAD